MSTAPCELSVQSRLTSEVTNQWTHAVGWGLSMIGGLVLMQTVIASEDSWKIAGCGAYVFALIGVYASSTLSHSMTGPIWRNRWRMLDQIFIFLLVVGSYSAYATSFARDGWLGVMLVAMWVIALAGIVARMLSGQESLPVVWYLPLGWMSLFGIGRMLSESGLTCVLMAFCGGLAYMSGTWFLANDHRHPLYHAVWHCFAMLGSAIHFFVIYHFVAMA